MYNKYQKHIINLLLLVMLIIGVITCSESISDNPISNKEPDTFLFIYENEGSELSQQPSRLRVHWWGDDPDGLIIGYYFNWQGLDDTWTFTPKNDSIFALPIGTIDTSFVFRVIAVDSEGNGKYDQQVMWNNTNLGPEPFIDRNNDGVYNEGEFYYDLGLIDQTPATQKFPIKNSSPEVRWSSASALPAESFPVVTVSWDATDLDGDESITQINLALNDTTEFISFERSVSLVTLRLADAGAAEPEMEILINGSDSDIFEEQLPNLVMNANNRLYIQAVDISGAHSKFIPLPDTSSNWYVKSPKGKLLIIDDYTAGDAASDFYNQNFDAINGGALVDKYDVLDTEETVLPFPNITFLETMKLFDYIYWYSQSEPSLDLLNLTTQKYLEAGGKIAFSMTFRDSSMAFPFDLATLQNFLPIDDLGEDKPISFLFPGASVIATNQGSNYPNLETATTISFIRTYIPSNVATPLYNLSSNQVSGNISFMDASKSLFFIGLPLHQCDGNEGTVAQLLKVIFFDEFGLTL